MQIPAILMGWPVAVIAMGLATFAVNKGRPRLCMAAMVLSLPQAFYLFGAANWIRAMAFYIPVSLALCTWLIHLKKRWPAALPLVPTYLFYVWLGILVLSE